MSQRLSKLLYVHDGDPGSIGIAIEESGRILRFPIEGSGVFGLTPDPTKGPNPNSRLVAVKIESASIDEVSDEVRTIAASHVPCIVGFAGTEPAMLVSKAGLARSSASTSDLRGKVRYGLARVGWDIE